MSLKIFIHGLYSGNQGTKAVFFREKFPDMLTPNFTGDLEERMEKLNAVLTGKSGIRIVGSSFGGLMASIYAMENESSVDKLILLAPAINLIGMTDYQNRSIDTPVIIYHGTNDDVIPLESIEPIAEKVFKNLTFNKVEDDHMLHNTFKMIDWDTLLD
ncbi:alpha/beta hydrolase [Thermodesulfobacteriota bacterium]